MWGTAGASLALAGCFYLDPINRRPSGVTVERQCDDADPTASCDLDDLHHGDSVTLDAVFTDPDSPETGSAREWKITACDGTVGDDSLTVINATTCDINARTYAGPAISPHFEVPWTLKTTGAPVRSIVADVSVFDDRGASAPQHKEALVHDGPTLTLRRSAGTYTVGAPIDLFATYGDPDDGSLGARPPEVALQWTPITPSGQVTPLTDLEVPQNAADPGHVMVGKQLVPQEAGAWDVRVIATGSHDRTNEKHLRFAVIPDQPPCLTAWQPTALPDGSPLVISEPTRFEASQVSDDLDPYPPVPDDPRSGTTAFAWSILTPGTSARQPLAGAAGNHVDLDPAAFTPGDLLELRVEIFDRHHTAVACADGDPVCSMGGLATCTQRQTWRVKIR